MLSAARQAPNCDHIYQQLLTQATKKEFQALQECLYDYSDLNVDYLTEIQNLALKDVRTLAANHQSIQSPQHIFNFSANIRRDNNNSGFQELLRDYRKHKDDAKVCYLTIAGCLHDKNIEKAQDAISKIHEKPAGSELLNAIKMRAIRLTKIQTNLKSMTGLFDAGATQLPIAVMNCINQYLKIYREAQPKP